MVFKSPKVSSPGGKIRSDLNVPLFTKAQSESVSDFIQSATKFPKFVSRVLTRAKRVSNGFLILIIGFALSTVQQLFDHVN